MKNTIRISAVLLALLLCLSLVACGAKREGVWEDATYTTDKTFGNGDKTITLTVSAEDQEVTFTIKTDEETLADALLAHEIVEGEDGPFGLYVKKVNGITADYDIDQTYWSLSKGGQMLMVGASDTVIANGEHYELTRAK